MTVKEVLRQRFSKIASNDPHAGGNFDEIRSRLLDLIQEADTENIF